MRIGVKTFYSPDFLRRFEKDSDFFEIMAIETENYDFISKFSKPWVIHSQHEKFGLNNADKQKRAENLKSLKFAISLADKCKSNKIIVHPGRKSGPSCSSEELISLIKSLNDKRILIENAPMHESFLGPTPEEMEKLLKETNAGLCFDINHAIETANFLKKDPILMIKDFIKLKPAHYHIGGQKFKRENKTHLSFQESEINLEEIFSLLPEDADITLEISTDEEKTAKDIELIKKFVKN